MSKRRLIRSLELRHSLDLVRMNVLSDKNIELQARNRNFLDRIDTLEERMAFISEFSRLEELDLPE